MIEKYAIKHRVGYAESTGTYELTQRNTRRAVVRFVEYYETDAGKLLPEDWKKQALAAIELEGETELLSKIKDHCKEDCAWLRNENELEEYAIECLCSRAYRHWKNFNDKEKNLIWM